MILRPHQLEAVSAIGRSAKGKVILPTGTGKSLIEFEIIRKRIKQQSKTGHGGIYAIFSPRILLSFQLLGQMSRYFIGHKLQALYMNINSGEFSAEELIRLQARMGLEPEHIKSTTSTDAIAKIMKSAEERNCPLLIACTYHSAPQLWSAASDVNADLQYLVYDEAQYTVDNTAFSQTLDYVSKGKYFFTATPRITDSDCGNGMNNEHSYGTELFRKTPRQMIEAGEMIGPAIHLVGVKGDYQGCDLTHDFGGIVRAIKDAFIEHKDTVKRFAKDPDKIGAKMMIVGDGQKAIIGIHECPEFAQMRIELPDVKIYMLCTDFGIYINGKHVSSANNRSKEELLLELQSLSIEDDAIVVHIDMLAEGIDVPGITGIMPFRNMGDAKFLQNLGRGTRLHQLDRAGLYAGEIQPNDKDNLIKPYCWLILPVFLANATDFTHRYLNMIERLRYEYEFKSDELIVLDNSNAITEEDDIPEVGDINQVGRMTPTTIKDFLHDIEDAEFIDSLAERTFRAKKMDKVEMFTLLCARMFMSDDSRIDWAREGF